jgi:hypothetical protein
MFRKWWSTTSTALSCACGVGGGSGNVAVVSVDAGDHGGSNGGSYNLAVAVLAELWSDLRNWLWRHIYLIYIFEILNCIIDWADSPLPANLLSLTLPLPPIHCHYHTATTTLQLPLPSNHCHCHPTTATATATLPLPHCHPNHCHCHPLPLPPTATPPQLRLRPARWLCPQALADRGQRLALALGRHAAGLRDEVWAAQWHAHRARCRGCGACYDVSVDSPGHGGSNGGGYNVWQWLLAVVESCECRAV